MQTIDIKLNDIPFDTPFRLEHNGTPIVVIRTKERITAYHDICPHAQWPLSEGEIVDGHLECPGHGWQFSLETGQCLNSPAYCLTSFLVSTFSDSVRIDCHQIPEKENKCRPLLKPKPCSTINSGD